MRIPVAFLFAVACLVSATFAGEVISSLDPMPPGFEFTREPDKVVVVGSWLNCPEPLNSARLVADRRKNTLSVATALLVTKVSPKRPFLALDQEECEIESWTDNAITSKRTRCGTSERFSQIVIDLKGKSVEQRFTGEYPAVQTLGDGAEQFKQQFAGTYRSK